MGNGDFKYFDYTPSLAAAVVFIVVFAIATSLHTWQMVQTRKWFMLAVVVGCGFEVLGYAGRVWCNIQTPNWTLTAYLIQELFILVAPAVISASLYMFLGRIIVALDGEKYSFIRRKWLTKIFVAGDVLSFFIQGAGGGFLGSSNPDTVQLGENIIIGGLFVQVGIFAVFLVVAALFHRRMSAGPTLRAQDPAVRWNQQMWVLHACGQLILVRNIVRIVEFLQGTGGVILTHEYFLYIFDATPVALAVLAFNVWHPGKLLVVAEHAAYELNEDAESSEGVQLSSRPKPAWA